MEAQSTGTIQSPSTHSESESKTGSSSKSGSKSTIYEKERELDLTQDNLLSPVDLECQIQSERMTKILDEALHKIKLCIILPALVKDYETLIHTISKDHFNDLMYIFEQYDNPLFAASLLDMSAMDDLKSGDYSMKFRLNPELGQLVYILHLNYKALEPRVDEVIDKMKSEFRRRSQDTDREPAPELEFLIAFERFREQLLHRMSTSAAEVLAREIKKRKLEVSNVVLLDKIEVCTKILKLETEKFEKTIASRNATIAQLEKELKFVNHAANMRLKKQILESDRQMVVASRSHDVRNVMLKEEEVETRESYEKFLAQHLREEKNLRAKRFKVETQLLTWLQKYDTDMTEKQLEMDDYVEKFEDELSKCEELEKKLAIQNIEYIPLMAERDEEYDKEMAAKMETFLLDHAARVIQHAWREVLANRAEKKKLKKLVQKVKEAEQKAQRRQDAIETAARLAAQKKKKKEKKKK